MDSWIKSMLEEKLQLEIEIDGFPKNERNLKFYVVRVGSDKFPAGSKDIEEVQKALEIFASTYEETKGLAKCIIVPHTIKIDEMEVEIKTRIK